MFLKAPSLEYLAIVRVSSATRYVRVYNKVHFICLTESVFGRERGGGGVDTLYVCVCVCV